MSMAVYSSDYASGRSYESYEAWKSQAQDKNQHWSPATQSQSALYNSQYHGYQQQYWYPQQVGNSQQAVQCCLNFSDYSDFSDSEDEPLSGCSKKKSDLKNQSSPIQDESPSESGSPSPESLTATLDLNRFWNAAINLLPKSNSTNETASTDAASTIEDGVSTADASDVSDDDSPENDDYSPQAPGRWYSRNSLLVLRMAIGMCASPPVQWSTKSNEKSPGASASATATGDGSEWRHGASHHQKQQGLSVTKLVASATSWVAQQRSRLDGSSDDIQQQDEEVARSIKAILNKLTVEKFDALYTQLIECGICKDSHIELLVQEIFDKACVQHHFVDMYADLCMRLEKWLDNAKTNSTATGFRRILLNQCQNSFEQSLQKQAELSSGISEEDHLEADIKHKQRVLGNAKLVGALLIRGMLSPRILLSCSDQLLKDPTAPNALECLAVLLTTVGPTFDDKTWSLHSLLCGVFTQVDTLTKNKEVPPRIRFILKDVLDLRATKWSNKKEVTKKTDTPMTIQQVHRQAALEEKGLTSQNAKKQHRNGDSKKVIKNNEKKPKELAQASSLQKVEQNKKSDRKKVRS